MKTTTLTLRGLAEFAFADVVTPAGRTRTLTMRGLGCRLTTTVDVATGDRDTLDRWEAHWRSVLPTADVRAAVARVAAADRDIDAAQTDPARRAALAAWACEADDLARYGSTA